MTNLVLDAVETEKTWNAIHGRIAKVTQFQVVPLDALETIEAVIMRDHDEAYDNWPTFSIDDQKCRVQFWKDRVLADVPADKRGLFAVYYHEYIAAIERSQDAEYEDVVIPSYGGHARAAHDAWVACTASLN